MIITGERNTRRGHTAPGEWEVIEFDQRKGRLVPIPWVKSPSVSRHCSTLEESVAMVPKLSHLLLGILH